MRLSESEPNMTGNLCLPEAPSNAGCELTKPSMRTITDSVTDQTKAGIIFPITRFTHTARVLQDWNGNNHMKISLLWDDRSDCQTDTNFNGNLPSLCIHNLHLYDKQIQIQTQQRRRKLNSERTQITFKTTLSSPLLLPIRLAFLYYSIPRRIAKFSDLFSCMSFSDLIQVFQVVN